MILASDVKKRYLFNVRFRVGLFYRNKKLREIVVKQRGIMKKNALLFAVHFYYRPPPSYGGY